VSISRRTAVFSGAGLSAESGIATFRGNDGHALWSQFNPMELASVAGFEDNPARVIEWYNWRRTQLARAQPNAAHRVLAKHSQLVQITQNVDDLLERAGVAASDVLHLHGTIGRDRCMASCGYEEAIDLAHPPPLSDCPRCGAYLRPAVVWFGEALPQGVWSWAERICSELDCLLVVGTSATVAPRGASRRGGGGWQQDHLDQHGARGLVRRRAHRALRHRERATATPAGGPDVDLAPLKRSRG
jgi:NAD-dependent deacetylase